MKLTVLTLALTPLALGALGARLDEAAQSCCLTRRAALQSPLKSHIELMRRQTAQDCLTPCQGEFVGA